MRTSWDKSTKKENTFEIKPGPTKKVAVPGLNNTLVPPSQIQMLKRISRRYLERLTAATVCQYGSYMISCVLPLIPTISDLEKPHPTGYPATKTFPKLPPFFRFSQGHQSMFRRFAAKMGRSRAEPQKFQASDSLRKWMREAGHGEFNMQKSLELLLKKERCYMPRIGSAINLDFGHKKNMDVMCSTGSTNRDLSNGKEA